MKQQKFRWQIFGAVLIGLLLLGCGAPAATPTEVPPTASPTDAPIKSTVPLAGVRGIETSGGYLWAWGENEIWAYTGGEWSLYSAAPASQDTFLVDVAYLSDTLWAVDNFRIQYLDGDDWQELSGQDQDVFGIVADDQTGILWVSDINGENLYRWNGEEMTDAGYPPVSRGFVGELAVTGDGTVWVGGRMYFPNLRGLARYDDAHGAWEMVRPWRADEDLPAQLLAPTPNGGLWVMLVELNEYWEDLQRAEKPWALAHRDGASGEWTVFEEGLPEGLPFAMAADDEAVWLAQGGGRTEKMEFDGLTRFDGETWSHYLPDDFVMDVGVAPDGSIWYATLDDDEYGLHLLR